MLLLLIISCFFLNIESKLLYPDKQENNNVDDYKGRNNFAPGRMQFVAGDPLWVLALNSDEWLDSKLSLATFEQEADFYHAVGSNANARRGSRPKKDDQGKSKKIEQTETRSNDELIKDIMKLINKFALYTNEEPDAYLNENSHNTNPSIVLYFKGPICCLEVKAEDKEWTYILNNFPFPAWFYARHDTFEAPLRIPEEIKNPFYSALLRLLNIVLYYPL